LYEEIGDYKGMVQLIEDQILRGKDPAVRTDLARKVARLWEERLSDAREAADAWRRVLRMKAGDPEATAGLDRAKSNMLKRSSNDISVSAPAVEKVEPPISGGVHSNPKEEIEPVSSNAAEVPDEPESEVGVRSPSSDDKLVSDLYAVSSPKTSEEASKELDVKVADESTHDESVPSSEATERTPAQQLPAVHKATLDTEEGATASTKPNPPQPPGRRPPPPPPVRSSARPPLPTPPIRGAAGSRAVPHPPSPPSLKPNLPPPPPSPVRTAPPPPPPHLPPEVDDLEDDDGASVDESELLE
jgi:hypothetical protein